MKERNLQIVTRVSKDEKEVIITLADELGVTVSTLIRTQLLQLKEKRDNDRSKGYPTF
jgi:hypothetical protein